jgi:hypothetical protein
VLLVDVEAEEAGSSSDGGSSSYFNGGCLSIVGDFYDVRAQFADQPAEMKAEDLS